MDAIQNTRICKSLWIRLRYSISPFPSVVEIPTYVWTIQFQNKDTYTYLSSFVTIFKENKADSIKTWNMKFVRILSSFQNISIQINQNFRIWDIVKTSSSSQLSQQHYLHELVSFVLILDIFLSLIIHVDSALCSSEMFTTHNTYSKVIIGQTHVNPTCLAQS